MKVKVPPKVHEIIDKFEKKGLEIYVVGGAIRDILMSKSVYDWDFTTNATPEEILKLFDNAYYTIELGKTLEEELKRRNFTINAMAFRLTSFAQGKPFSKKHLRGNRTDSSEVEFEFELIDPYDG